MHPRTSIHFLDEEDVVEVCQAFHAGNQFVLVNGVRIDLYYNIFKVYELLQKFSSPFDAEECFRKATMILGRKFAFADLKTEAKDVTKEFLKKIKSVEKIASHGNMERTKIFISHSSEDIEIVKSFVNEILRQGFAIHPNQIFCSTMDGFGVENGKYIPDVLKEELQQSQLVFLFLSDNYKNSEVCLNELGAAWVSFEKNRVIPLILPNCGFDKLGFLDQGRLGTKLVDQSKMEVLIENTSKLLSIEIKLPIINEHLKNFILFAKSLQTENPEKIERKESSEYERCFSLSLYPFTHVFNKTLPHLHNGIHQLTDKNQIKNLLTNLSNQDFPGSLWYTYIDGDSNFSKVKLLTNGNWNLDGWEIKIPELWVNIHSSIYNEFILIKSEPLPPYQIQSDVGGESYSVGIREDGFMVSETERGNGYALINGESVKLDYQKVESRYRSDKLYWIFISTQYHKTRVNVNQTIAFCEDIDSKKSINEEDLKKFVRNLTKNHPIVMENL